MGARPGPTRGFRRGVFFACLFTCFLGLAFVLARQAVAAEPVTYAPPAEAPLEPAAPEGQPSCPAPELEPFEGEDVAAGEVRLLRGELAEACAALSARLDRLRERSFWSVAEAALDRGRDEAAQASLDQANERLADLAESPCDKPCPVEVEGSAPVEVQDAAGQQYSDELVSAVDASGEASKGGLYMLIGVVVAFFVGLMLAKVVDRGT
jgi:hypothetical protein